MGACYSRDMWATFSKDWNPGDTSVWHCGSNTTIKLSAFRGKLIIGKPTNLLAQRDTRRCVLAFAVAAVHVMDATGKYNIAPCAFAAGMEATIWCK